MENKSSEEPQICDQPTEMEEEKPKEVEIVNLNCCVVCKKDKPPYKCPTCKLKYCSVNCCKTHKSDGCQPASSSTDKTEIGAASNEVSADRNFYFPTKDTVPEEKLKMLTQGNNLIEIKKFLQDPSIRSNIIKLDTCANPSMEFGEVMQDERFVQFAQFLTCELNKDEIKKARTDFDQE